MGKQKVYEIAKSIGIDNKELIDRLKGIGIDVKSHLSSLTEEDIKLATQKGILSIEKTKKQELKEENKGEKQAKGSNPVIIRREVIREFQEEKKIEKKNNIGVIENKKGNNYNLRNRQKQKTQVGSIADLFKKPEIKEENIIKTNEKVILKEEKEIKKEEIVEVKKEALNEKIDNNKIIENKNIEEKKEMNNSNFKQNKKEFDKKNNNFKNAETRFNDKNNFKQNKDYKNNKDRNKTNDNYQNKRNNINNKQDNKNNDRFKANKIEKDIKNIVEQPIEKVIQKDFTRNKVKNNNEDSNNQNNKKTNIKNRNNNNNAINMGKLKDLKSHNSLSNMFNDNEGGMLDYYDLSHNRKANKKNKKVKEVNNKREFEKNKIFELTEIKIPEYITVKDFAEMIKKTSSDVIKKLLGLGIMATINQELDFDTAYLIAQEFGINAEKLVVVTDEDILFDDSEDLEENLEPRAPVVVVMGHVDHGKTSLLDAIRSTNVIDNEAGGITQHIGAYKVKVNERDITFLDTPGHEAFTAMRARGAQVTDIAILIVAADDGIMPQTIEAINHAKAAEVPIIVAINKIDKEGANIARIKESIMEYGLVPEEWGGDTICVPISAKQKTNIDELLEMVLLVADMKNLKANPNKQSKGTVIESRLDKNKGVITSVLVQRGTLNVGDTIVVGSTIGKIRVMTDDKGKKIKAAGPSTPVEIIGLPETPEGGDIFYEVENEKVAKHLIETRKIKEREQELRANNRVTLDDLFSQIEAGKTKELNIIVKADVQGSVEAVKQSLLKLSTKDVKIKVIHANVGAVSVSDVTLAKVANAIIIGFNVRPDVNAKAMSEAEKVDVRLYSVIYHAIEDVQKAMKGMLDPEFREAVLGLAEVRNTFKVSSVGTIAGCYVLDGKIVRNGLVRIIRDGVVIYQGKIASLKRFKDDVKEAAAGYECGIQIENYNDIKEQDQIECYIMEEIKE